PTWPAFRPSLPLGDLEPEPMLDARVFLLRNFWPRSLCRDYVSFLRTLSLTTTPGKPKRGDAVRVNDRFQVEDQAFAQRLWVDTGLKETLLADEWKEKWGGEVVGLSPNIRIYRYSPGQFFDAHYDDSNTIRFTSNQGPVVTRTTWTLLLYLTSAADGCHGGETVFYPNDRKTAKEEIAVPPETGMVLLHKHGHDCMLHEGREVTAGEKWIIRTDLCVRK
ncbi:alpha subunit of prolyl 4-hydroxylase, partial [Coniella lustricola]